MAGVRERVQTWTSTYFQHHCIELSANNPVSELFKELSSLGLDTLLLFGANKYSV